MSELKPRPRQWLYYSLILLAPLLLLVYLSEESVNLPLLLSRPNLSVLRSTNTCPYSVVYNKPHKTAGTKIQSDIVEWANRSHWRAVTCSPYDFNLRVHECVPDDTSGCVIVANHMVVDPTLERLFQRKLGSIRWMTSTRSGRERRLSHFLQVNKIKAQDAALEHLKKWLKVTDPWLDYNYMNGDQHSGSCPINWAERQMITSMVSKYDIVIDADLPEVSNVILKHFGLFPLTESFKNVRGASSLTLDGEAEEMLSKVTCVDEEMHRQFRIRMGSLYEKITGVPCLNDSRGSEPCL